MINYNVMFPKIIVFKRLTYESFNVEALSWLHLSSALVGERSQNSSLSSVIETEHKNSCLAHLFLESTELREESHILFF